LQLSLRRKSKRKKLQKKQQNLWNICTQLAASSLQRIEASKKSFKRSNRISGTFVVNLQQVPFRELKQAKRKASEEAREISDICTKLEQLPLRTKSAKQKNKLQKKQQKFLQGFVLNYLQISFREFKQAKKEASESEARENLQDLNLQLSFERKEQAKNRLPMKRAKSPTFVLSLQLPFREEEQAKKVFGGSKRTLQGFVLNLQLNSLQRK
jgi:hypothetical protein